MKPQFEFVNELIYIRDRDYPFECEWCQKTFFKKGKWINLAIQQGAKSRGRFKFCSRACCASEKHSKAWTIGNCAFCNKGVKRSNTEIKKNKTKNIFCNNSCAASYNNTHKTTGNRKSKLECWLEEQLPLIYPELEFQFNRKNTINSELDIYIPCLKLAFELNGIFHYEPIYGIDKLGKIQNNDKRKFQACLEHGIELCIIDSSKHKRFNENSCRPFLNIIKNIIDIKISALPAS